MAIIKVKNLKYRYPETKELALKGISFSIKKAEFIGIIGQNTAGKSTLCYALAGLVPHFFKGAYGGQVFINGTNIREENLTEVSSKVGLIFENPFSQISGAKFTVYEEVAFGLENLGIPRKEMIERVDKSLHLLDIYSIKDKNPFNLSGGQMQRVAIASVIAMEPDILILDEPTSQLDPKGTEEVYQVIENLTKIGITIILAEQKMEKIATYANRVMLLHDGEIIDFDIPQKVFSRDDLRRFGVEAPLVTEIAKEIQLQNEKSNYPMNIKEFLNLLLEKSGEK